MTDLEIRTERRECRKYVLQEASPRGWVQDVVAALEQRTDDIEILTVEAADEVGLA
jgi:hypothetical protein